MDIKELKATAYDLIANIEFLQSKLKEINTLIAEESKKNGSDNSNNDN